MQMNHLLILFALAGLAGIGFLSGCGSPEQKPSKTLTNTDQMPRKTTATPTLKPGEPKSPGETEAKSTKESRAKPLPKITVQPKQSALPVESSKRVPSPPVKIEETFNPVRSPLAKRVSGKNPIRPENQPLESPQLENAPLTSPAPADDESGLPTGAKLYMRESEDKPGAANTESIDLEEAETVKNEYTVVKVFYGTDRASSSAIKRSQAFQRQMLMMTVGAAAATLFLSFIAFRSFKSRLLRDLAYTGMFMSVIFGVLTSYARYTSPSSGQSVNVSSSSSVSYSGERGTLELGSCEVSIPKRHEVGELESPSVLRLEFSEDPSRHVVLLKVQPVPADVFYADLRSSVERSTRKSAFVFVHGYNFSFDEAARRTAQIAYDLKFDGVPIFFSWPSQGGIWGYTIDETNVAWTVPHLRQFLTDVASQSGAKQIHLIAHSMGNRALTSAMRDLSFLPESARPKFNEVVLTAPDIDAEVFKYDIAPAVVKMASRRPGSSARGACT